MCKLFALRIVTWSNNCLLRIIIIISYLKPCNCVQIICIKRFICQDISAIPEAMTKRALPNLYLFVCLFGFYGISTLVGYLMLNPLSLSLSLYIYIYIYIYICYFLFRLVEFYGISPIEGYLMLNSLYIYIYIYIYIHTYIHIYIYILDIWVFGLVLWHINHGRLLIPNPFLYI